MRKNSLDDSWLFRKLPDCTPNDIPEISLLSFPAEKVTLPHTWYTDDDQYRGLCVYEKEIPKPEGDGLILSFDAADQNCIVFVNDILIGQHRGGYSRFRFPIPAAVTSDMLQIRVFVDNRLNEDICPSFGDFTVFGGLYRNAELLVLGKDHFDRCYYGTDGLIIRTELDEDGNGLLKLEPHTVTAASAVVQYIVTNEEGSIVSEATADAETPCMISVKHPRLWNGRGDSHLYTVSAKLRVNSETVDEVRLQTGFRTIELTADRGLLLNGRNYPLCGVAKHQDRAGVYCAVNKKNICEDFALIDEIGANAVRLSHYQHPQEAYDCCDQLGLLVWAEVPMLKMTESAALIENTEQQLRELILQNIHHPGIFCWGIQNEIAMFKDAPYMHENCRLLHGVVKALDPGRVSAAANLYPLKASSKLNEITDMVGYNLYFGWYYGEMRDYSAYLDKMHTARPALPLGISEYGVDANLSLHSSDPHVKDYSEEYQALWHETVYPQIQSRSWLWGSFVWNMFDFSSSRRNEGGQRFINAKGLVSHDRLVRKDAFYYYKSQWSEEPFVHLCGRRYAEHAQESINVKVYTNQPEVNLCINGVPFGSARAENGTVLFHGVPLRIGDNHLAASFESLEDQCVIKRVDSEPESYRLPDSGEGPVRNWFLSEDDITKEGYYSLNNTANDLLDNPRTRAILDRYIPELVRVMTEKNVIPLGLTLKNILSRDADGVDLETLNTELNQVPNED